MTETWFPHKHRTANDGITFEGEATGGGGSGGVQVVTVPVSSAEILALHDTDVTLIAGAAGSVIVVIGAGIVNLVGGTPYVGDPTLYVATRPVSDPGNPLVALAGQVGLELADDQIVAQPYGGGQITLANSTLSDWDGQPVILTTEDPNPTDGDGTLLVTLSYFLAPTA